MASLLLLTPSTQHTRRQRFGRNSSFHFPIGCPFGTSSLSSRFNNADNERIVNEELQPINAYDDNNKNDEDILAIGTVADFIVSKFTGRSLPIAD